jgi:hypothetical protein
MINFFEGDGQFSTTLYQSFTNNQFPINNEPDIAYP